MFCPNCGTEISENAHFCPVCGKEIISTGEKKETEKPAGDKSQRRASGTPSHRTEPAGLYVVRKTASSKMFLTAVISYTATIALRLLTAATATSTLTDYLNLLLNELSGFIDTDSLGFYLQQFTGKFSTISFFMFAISNIPEILTAIALWMIYREAKKRGRFFSTSGFSVLWVLTVIQMGLLIMTALLSMFLVLGILTAVSGITDDGRSTQGIVLFVGLLLIVLLLLALMYYWKIQRMLAISKRIVTDGRAESVGSIYVGVLIIIGAVGNLPALISASGAGKLQILAAEISSLCFALLIFSFRDRMETAVRRQNMKEKENQGTFHEYVAEESSRWGEDDGSDSSGDREVSGNDPCEYSSLFKNYGADGDRGFETITSGFENNGTYVHEEAAVLDSPETAPAGNLNEWDADHNQYAPMFGFFNGEDTVVEDLEEGFLAEKNERDSPDLPTWIENTQDDRYLQSSSGEEKVSSMLRNSQEDPFKNREKPVLSENRNILSENDVLKEAERKREEEKLAREQEQKERERREQEQRERERREQEQRERERREREQRERERREQEQKERERREQEAAARKREEERIAREREERTREAEEKQHVLDLQRQENRVMNNGRETYQTTPLNSEFNVQPTAYMIRSKDSLKIIVREQRLRIGRNPREVDYLILDNPAIGRHHADIVFRDGRYFIIDHNSKNHVYINGVMIPPNQEIPLQDQAVVRLADEDYLFRIN